MTYVFIGCFVVGILLAVRILFFGAERQRFAAGATPVRGWELAGVGFISMFGLAGYLLLRSGARSLGWTILLALLVSAIWAAVVTRLAVATAHVVPEVDPDDPRYSLQGHVAVVTSDIPSGGAGEVRLEESAGVYRVVRARNIETGSIDAGEEVCIERIEDGVAFVERWSIVEKRL